MNVISAVVESDSLWQGIWHDDLVKRTVFHEAGHAVAIILGNRSKDLPPVFFQIHLGCFAKKTEQATMARSGHKNLATVQGGHLLDNLPVTVLECSGYYSPQEKNAYQAAVEADVFNLLVGPLAEARYIAERDGEVFCHDLLPLTILARHYGGEIDINQCMAYLDGLIADPGLKTQKLQEIYRQACEFVKNSWNWRIIEHLVKHLLEAQPESIDCEHLLLLIEQYRASRPLRAA
ncbi:MAG: hypothetical protein RQ715_09125 [Methylococcales bacterium]|nr:hypothetical protein [Methylococcales bacterium]